MARSFRSRPPLSVAVLAAVALVALALPGGAVAGSDYSIVQQTSRDLPGDLVRTETIVQAGSDPLARFAVTRVSRSGPAPLDRPLLLMPPLGNGFEFYEVPTRAGGAYTTSFAGFLATQGYDVWGYSPRTRDIAAGTCESGAADCSGFDGWGIASQVADALYLREVIVAARATDPVVGGYSLGGIGTVALLDAAPDAWAGAMLLEGTIHTADPAVRALNLPYCQAYEALLAAGLVYDGQTTAMIKLVARLAGGAPDEPTPLPGFPPGTTNHQVLVALLALPADNPLSPTEEFIRLAGSFEDDRFFYADADRVIRHSVLFYDYVANRVVRDVACSIAGVETSFVDGLAAYTGPVYVLGGGVGFGPLLEDTVTLLGSTDVTWNLVPEFGHADHWFAPFHRSVLETDLASWLRSLD